MVIRNAGGRVSPDVLTDLAYIGYLSGVVIPGGRPRLRREYRADHHHRPGRAHARRPGGVRMSTPPIRRNPDV
jgi:hypothetical protein